MQSQPPLLSATEVDKAFAQPHLDAGPRPAGEAPLVLVIEDDDDMRFLYRESLGHLGYRTAGEPDGESGFEAAVRLQPDAILLDAEMPGVNGIETTRLIKADARTQGCFVIVVAGYGMAMFDEAHAAGCDAFFSKPFDPTTFDRILHALSTSAEPPRPQVSSAIVKRCACGRAFSRNQWRALPRCGRMHLPQRGAILELRNCTCGTSLSVDLEALGDAVPRLAIAEAAEAVLERMPDARRETVFLVDRDPHVRRLVQQFLGDAYDVQFFDDGCAALERVRTSPPAALITEILVAQLDGLALCRSLKADPATEHVPVLVFSMLAADERARQAGADAFLGKPIERKRLVASLRSLMEPRGRGNAHRPQELRAP